MVQSYPHMYSENAQKGENGDKILDLLLYIEYSYNRLYYYISTIYIVFKTI